MTFWKSENSIESKKNFRAEIEKYYSEISNEQIPNDILNEIIRMVTDKKYADYKRWWKQYPKSRKRYSKLKLDDLEHDFVYFQITEYLNKTVPNKFRNYSKILLKVNDVEFDKYLERKYWYENK
jgi:hypothetical protein|tara:strand:+ start:116 stop:487 length:372 start_codon:yes stop_codon:yes gene_type:complete